MINNGIGASSKEQSSINSEIDASSSAIGQFSTTLPTNDNGEEA